MIFRIQEAECWLSKIYIDEIFKNQFLFCTK